MTRYAICTIPRTGSTWLCDLLRGVGWGEPMEAFSPDEWLNEWRRCHGLPERVPSTPSEYEQLIQAASVAGIFGVKLQGNQPNVRDFLDYAGCHLIWLRRKDITRQAISLYRAEKTGKWCSTLEATGPEPDFDAEEIRAKAQWLASLDEEWESYFDGRRLLTLWYEDAITDPTATLELIGDVLAQPSPKKMPADFITVQRDEITEKWVKLL